MNINFDKRIFNPLFWKIKKANTRFVINYGGAGSSKSYTQTQHEILKCLSGNETLLVIRKVGSTLNDSCVSLFKSILNDWQLSDFYTLNKVEKRITFNNGSQILFKGLDDPEKIKSIAGVTRIWVEEASELDEADLNQLNTRLRGKNLKNPQLTITFNPIDENHWIKKSFFDVKRDDTTIFKTTYLDNNFIDDDYKKTLEDFKVYDYNHYRVYALGDWGKTNIGGEFYKKFDGSKHVINTKYNPNEPLHISFDENVSPYLACIISQIRKVGNNWELHIIDEITEWDKNLEDVCNIFKERYYNHREKIYIYGDATSQKRDVKLERGHNFFNLILKHLEHYHCELRVPSTNPSVSMRGNFINKQLFDDDKIKVRISNTCSTTIQDFENVKTSKDGNKDKKLIRDKMRNISYQEYGHTSDTFDYLFCYVFNDEYQLYQRGGVTFKPKMGMRKRSRF